MNETDRFLNGTYSREYFDVNGYIRIPLYSVIFLLSVIGNSLVICTLIQNHKMRTITNLFLLSLSVSDLLLAVLCMPFTLIPLLMRNFIFGEVICISIRFLQAVSVCVSCFTLVAISAERYFAICHPLRSRTWQTLSHAYKTIICIWICALILMIPIAAAQEIKRLRTGNEACREIWAEHLEPLHIAYSIILVMILFVIPLCIMIIAYGIMAFNLWFSIKQQMNDPDKGSNDAMFESSIDINEKVSTKRKSEPMSNNISLRSTNMRSCTTHRKRVIKMLFVVVFEYFICCSPLYILNTWKVIDYKDIHQRLSDTAWSLILLLFYSSSCIHPITYCFMNKNFRKSFLYMFRCFLKKTKPLGRTCTEMSTLNTTTQRRNRPKKQVSQDIT